MPEIQSIFLSLCDATRPASEAAESDSTFRSVIATDGSKYFLISEQALETQVSLDQTLGQVDGDLLLKIPGTEPPCDLGGADVVVGAVDEVEGETFIRAYFDPVGAFARIISHTRWECVPHGERYVRRAGGQCPRHANGTLRAC